MFHVQLVVCIVAIVITHLVYKWMNPKCDGKLPPGSMGFPIIGETIEFFTPHALYGIPPFVQKRIARYGSIFRTSIVGRKVIVSTDPEINYSIFQQEGKSFLIWYRESFIKILGGQSMLSYHGMVHKYLKNMILHLVSPENLRVKLLPEMDSATCLSLQFWASHGHVDVKEEASTGLTCLSLQFWASHGHVDVKEEASTMIFEYLAKKLISYEESKGLKKLKDHYNAFIDGVISFPINIPGTTYHACLQGRKNVVKVIKEIVEKRKESKIRENDFLDHLVEEVEKQETILDEAIAIDLVFVLLFATYETTSAAITLAIKFISDYPQVIAELTVINETVRLANIVPGIFRKVVQDVEMQGYIIPAGWIVMVVPSVLHLNPDKYEDPMAFNPWRWEGKELHAGSKTFMAFGGGVRLCVGADFAKLQMAVFLHHLVTKYRWKICRGGDIIRRPGLVFPNGFHIEITKKDDDKINMIEE